MIPPARTAEQRKKDVLNRLEHDVDAWVATAAPATGAPHMVPLSFMWDGTALLLATPSASPTGRNLRAAGTARIGVGETRDVVLIEGAAEALEAADLPEGTADAFAARTGFEPRGLAEHYLYFRVRPTRIQAWREVNELRGRDVMRGGRWLVPG